MNSNRIANGRAPEDELTVRWARAGDRAAIRRLAERDSRSAPTGATLVAELGGTIVAATPPGEGETIADPFRPTRDIVDLLELRAAQVASNGQPKGRGVAALWLSRRFVGRGRKVPRPSVAQPKLAGR